MQSEELKARLRKLEELAERKAYAELVKDITPKKGTDEPFSSYKDQIGFGMNQNLNSFAFIFWEEHKCCVKTIIPNVTQTSVISI